MAPSQIYACNWRQPLLTILGISPEEFLVSPCLPGVPGFISRQIEIEDIYRRLSGNTGRRTVVLYGMDGIGKTQLALAYANRYKNNYSAIFWLNIRDEDSAKNSFAHIARQIQRNNPLACRISRIIDATNNLDDVVSAVREWLSLPNNTQWLMVYDGYDNPAVDISKFLPEANQGSAIITTRSSQVLIGSSIKIQKIEDINKCLEILSNTSKRQLDSDGKGEFSQNNRSNSNFCTRY